METDWMAIISASHQDKLASLAQRSGVSTDHALRNIVNHLKDIDENTLLPDFFREVITAHDIERMIDMIGF
jgi:hypothetical protein